MPLSQADLRNLQAFADAGDRYSYWDYLSRLGDQYASFSKQVVTDESIGGYIANLYMQDEARQRGVTIDYEKNWSIGVDVMRADLDARKGDPGGGINLYPKTIYDYHREVFKGHNLGSNNEAWAASEVLRPYIESGDSAGLQAVWSSILTGGISTQAGIFSLMYTRAESGDIDAGTWVTRVAPAATNYALETEFGSDTNRISYRNIGNIGGWTQDEAGNWRRPLPMSNVDPLGVSNGRELDWEYADTEKAFQLNEEKRFREEHFRGNKTDFSSQWDPKFWTGAKPAAAVFPATTIATPGLPQALGGVIAVTARAETNATSDAHKDGSRRADAGQHGNWNGSPGVSPNILRLASYPGPWVHKLFDASRAAAMQPAGTDAPFGALRVPNQPAAFGAPTDNRNSRRQDEAPWSILRQPNAVEEAAPSDEAQPDNWDPKFWSGKNVLRLHEHPDPDVRELFGGSPREQTKRPSAPAGSDGGIRSGIDGLGQGAPAGKRVSSLRDAAAEAALVPPPASERQTAIYMDGQKVGALVTKRQVAAAYRPSGSASRVSSSVYPSVDGMRSIG